MKLFHLSGLKTVPKAMLVAVILVASVTFASPVAAAAPAGATDSAAVAITAKNSTLLLDTVTAYAPAGTDGVTALSCSLLATRPIIIPVGQSFGPYSATFYTGIGAASWVTCTGAVAGIQVAAALAWGGALLAVGPPVGSTGTSASPTAYVADVCTSGSWQGGGDAVVQWPPQYQSPPGYMSGFTTPRYVDPASCVS